MSQHQRAQEILQDPEFQAFARRKNAVAGMLTGLILAVVLIVLGPAVWTDVLKNEGAAPFPLKNPAIISIPAAFIVSVVVSLLKRDPDAELRFEDEKLRTYVGIGAE